MKKKTIMLAFGTRPEAIKMAPLVKEFLKHPDIFDVIICVTGQHREMLDQVLKLFEIEPDFDLNIMKQGQDLYDVTSRILIGMRTVFDSCKPDMVLVHGDTTTSTATALAAFYQQIPVGHIEAGLRTYDIYSPWPEEMNRQITSRIATYNFSPTEMSKKNLINEGVDNNKILVTGNTVIDALHIVVEKIKKDKNIQEFLSEYFDKIGYDTTKIKDGKKIVLITGHRRENFGDGFTHICNAIKKLSEIYLDIDFIFPMHLNPNVRKPVMEIFGNIFLKNVYFVEPLDYLPFIYLMENSYLLLTDSGGIQEEAPSLGKPVLVMRNSTERPEALEAGTVKLIGTDYNEIILNVSSLIDDTELYNKMSKASNPYGDGLASSKIVKWISKLYHI